MRVLVLCFLAFVAVTSEEIEEVIVCKITCEPDDEFEDPDNVSGEWDNFMTYMSDITVSDYEKTCQNNTDQKVINPQVIYDELWELRFKIYQERLDETGKTLNDCYCQFQDEQCKSVEFRECMASARVSMLSEFVAQAANITSTILEELSQQC